MKKIVLFGASQCAEILLQKLPSNCEVICLLDNDSNKHNTIFMGFPVKPPDALYSLIYDYIVISSLYYDEIFEQLRGMGIAAEKITPSITQHPPTIDPYFFRKNKMDNIADNFGNGYYPLYPQHSTLNKRPGVCTTQLCNQEFFGLPLFQFWYNKIYARNSVTDFSGTQLKFLGTKEWEFVYVAQALYENDMLHSGRHGLCFACGTEPLPALFASMGCQILATDLDVSETHPRWITAGQHAKNDILNLHHQGICPDDIFLKNVKYMSVDMNKIPETLYDRFDFNWSVCAVEHIGGLDKILDFLINNLRTLKSGGLAVHTMEFNISTTDDDTLNLPTIALLRKKDIDQLFTTLAEMGHEVFPFDYKIGNYDADYFINMTPPYLHYASNLRREHFHWSSTVIGIIVKKDGLQC